MVKTLHGRGSGKRWIRPVKTPAIEFPTRTTSGWTRTSPYLHHPPFAIDEKFSLTFRTHHPYHHCLRLAERQTLQRIDKQVLRHGTHLTRSHKQQPRYKDGRSAYNQLAQASACYEDVRRTWPIAAELVHLIGARYPLCHNRRQVFHVGASSGGHQNQSVATSQRLRLQRGARLQSSSHNSAMVTGCGVLAKLARTPSDTAISRCLLPLVVAATIPLATNSRTSWTMLQFCNQDPIKPTGLYTTTPTEKMKRSSPPMTSDSWQKLRTDSAIRW